jgi:hypothetical protein
MSLSVPGFVPETEIEHAMARDPMLLRTWSWGRGKVGQQVGAILDVIDAERDPMRRDLRQLALLHDAFEFRVRSRHAWSPDDDRLELAQRFAARYGCGGRIAGTLALHDAPYWVWQRQGGDVQALDAVLSRAPEADLLLRFVELGAALHGETPRFVDWLHRAAGRVTH